MSIKIGQEYNIVSVVAAHRNHPNPIFRGKVEKKLHSNLYDVSVTQYNITDKYRPGDKVNVEDYRFDSLVIPSNNRNATHLLKRSKGED